jgi:hypothetical protein
MSKKITPELRQFVRTISGKLASLACIRNLAWSGFDRRLLKDGCLIESTCVRCGLKIIGSFSEGLPQHEADHLATCRIPRTPPAKAA